MRKFLLAAAIGLMASGAQAAVTARSDTEFTTSYRETVSGAPAQGYEALAKVGAC